ISDHNASSPLFLYLPFQNVHSPNEAPESFVKQYEFIEDKTRRIYAGMVTAVDEAIGNVTDAMKKKGIWDDTLMVFTTDNGGRPIYGGYNWPLRGMKLTLWEGGVRGVGFVHGSMIEKKPRKCNELLHVTDWFPTLSAIAGFDEFDQNIDGFNMWDTISKGAASPRTEILHNIDVNDSSVPLCQGIALRSGNMKLIMQVMDLPWFKPPELGKSGRADSDKSNEEFVIKEALFNITADPEERNDLSAKLPDVLARMKARVDFYKKGMVPKRNQPEDPDAEITAKRNGAWTPWRGSIGH
ncbi:arylsulfatase B, partial [Exaiptasia diaphana]|uniref:Sulfatase N-terminal domain-containing protein n=1 Tax=Exaiptasia diaphana TaxID=2652724 RepID=A0A913XLN5_EXADI